MHEFGRSKIKHGEGELDKDNDIELERTSLGLRLMNSEDEARDKELLEI